MKAHEPVIPQNLVTEPGQDALLTHEVRCTDCQICTRENRILPADLRDFVSGVLQQHTTPPNEAETVARVLVASDQRGIQSHGVARLGRYLTGIQAGYIRPGVEMKILEPTPSIAVVDAQNGLGQVAGEAAMDLAITKAKKHGLGLATVKNSNHYGIAGYYVQKALDHRMIGVSMTNSAPLTVPTFSAEMLLGTNPIALGAPASNHPDFLLDMATSVVPRGKLEVYDRNRRQMPRGWTVDDQGYDCQNPGQVLRNLVDRVGGGILPLGGRGEKFSGYKGYGLAFLVDILSGVLSGAAFGPEVHNLNRPVPEGEVAAPNVGHFFLCIDIGRFMPPEEFEARLDGLIERIKSSKKALDSEVVYIHGEKEHALATEHELHGIPLAQNVMCTLVDIARECDQPPPRVR